MHTDNADALLAQLQHWLGDSPDANWNEYISEQVAKGVLRHFTEAQWQQLDRRLLEQPEYWQQRCVAALGGERSAAAIALLKRVLLESPHLDVRIMAIYELDWCETPIEHRYRASIQEVIASLPAAEVEPELRSLLAKTEAATP